jgi:hypothetical protein
LSQDWFPTWLASTPSDARIFHHTCLDYEHDARMWSMVSASWSHKKQLSAAESPRDQNQLFGLLLVHANLHGQATWIVAFQVLPDQTIDQGPNS